MLDFGVTLMDETYGRERRHRWFTFKGYKALLDQENINEAEHEPCADLTNTGGFTDVSPDLFYDTLDQLRQHQDTDIREETTKRKRKPPKNPILPDGTVKRGRPRKDQAGTNKRKREDLAEDDGADGQSRPPKKAKTVVVEGGGLVDTGQGTPIVEPTPRKRGRPPKRKPEGDPPATPTPRKRGRPPKNRTPATVEEQPIQGSGGQTLSTIALLVPAQEVVSDIPRDMAGLPILSYPETFEQTVQQKATPAVDTLHPVGDSQPTLPPELHLPTLEPREPIQESLQDADRVSI
jgi:hypothetical protein